MINSASELHIFTFVTLLLAYLQIFNSALTHIVQRSAVCIHLCMATPPLSDVTAGVPPVPSAENTCSDHSQVLLSQRDWSSRSTRFVVRPQWTKHKHAPSQTSTLQFRPKNNTLRSGWVWSLTEWVTTCYRFNPQRWIIWGDCYVASAAILWCSAFFIFFFGKKTGDQKKSVFSYLCEQWEVWAAPW